MLFYAHTKGPHKKDWEPLFTPTCPALQNKPCSDCENLTPTHGHLNKVAHLENSGERLPTIHSTFLNRFKTGLNYIVFSRTESFAPRGQAPTTCIKPPSDTITTSISNFETPVDIGGTANLARNGKKVIYSLLVVDYFLEVHPMRNFATEMPVYAVLCRTRTQQEIDLALPTAISPILNTPEKAQIIQLPDLRAFYCPDFLGMNITFTFRESRTGTIHILSALNNAA